MNWFRFYHEALEDPKVQRLPGELYKAWVNLLCLASKGNNRGVLPSEEDIAFALRISAQEAGNIVAELMHRELLDETDDGLMPHNWPSRQRSSDTSNERVARFRAKNQDKNDGNVTGNVTNNNVKRDGNALDTEQNREDTEDPPNPPEGDSPSGEGGRPDLQSLEGGKGKPRKRSRVPKAAQVPDYTPEFEAFWKICPRKDDKKPAFRAWQALMDLDASLEPIITAAMLEARKNPRWYEEGGRFCPMVSTWLNNGRFENKGVQKPDDDPPDDGLTAEQRYFANKAAYLRRGRETGKWDQQSDYSRYSATTESGRRNYDQELAECERVLAGQKRGAA